ncbi:hypothetical protein [Burkholderia sp. Ac-20365]|nr:hypothetical protein [Burkholderia sp. Ac-20365]MBN3760962.1 hypothetical protein [Burkholderia sp. Ac-20365]
MNEQTIKYQRTPARQIDSQDPNKSYVYLNGCKLTEVRINGVWVCTNVE